MGLFSRKTTDPVMSRVKEWEAAVKAHDAARVKEVIDRMVMEDDPALCEAVGEAYKKRRRL